MSSEVALQDRDLGGGEKPPLVLLHGLLGSSRNWQTAGAALSAERRVWALDLRNHGRSPHAEGMDYETMAGDVLAWMDRRGLGRADLLGHSMGGKVAMTLACRQADRVASLTVVDIAPRDYLSHAHRAEFAAMAELDLDSLESRGEAELRFESRVPDWGMRKFLATNLERGSDGRWRWAVNLPVLTAALPRLEKSPLGPGERFEGPTLFVTGGRSPYVGAGDLEGIHRHFPSAQVEVIPDSGHNPHMDAREDFVARVAGFLRLGASGRVSPAGSSGAGP
jgi:esterase